MKHALQLSVVFSDSLSELSSHSHSYWSAYSNLHLLVYGCKTLCLTVRKEYRSIVLEDKVVKKIFEARREDVTED